MQDPHLEELLLKKPADARAATIEKESWHN
jgi:hypothetical protein